jgi:hypothetical protein
MLLYAKKIAGPNRYCYLYIKEKYKVYYIKPGLHNLGVMLAKSSFGHDIKIYDVERTICDIARSHSKIDLQIFNDTLKRYTKLQTSNFLLLNEYVQKFNKKLYSATAWAATVYPFTS